MKYADSLGLILLAPRGGIKDEKPSWNGGACCDPAVDKDRDDIGFIDLLLVNLIDQFPLTFPHLSLSFTSTMMTGFSNGGFMVDRIGWSAAGDLFPHILGIAPMAGYIYDHKQYVNRIDSDSKRSRHSMAVWIHHSVSDEVVQVNGCCDTNPCKAGIDERSNECVSVEQEWTNWMEWNGCNLSKYNLSFDAMAKVIDEGKHGYSCAFATKQHECRTPTRLCLHQKTPHSQWVDRFPMEQEVIMFFMKVLCEQNGGRWDGDQGVEGECQCDEDSGDRIGRYCGTERDLMDIDWQRIERGRQYLVSRENEGEMENGQNEYHPKRKMPVRPREGERSIPSNEIVRRTKVKSNEEGEEGGGVKLSMYLILTSVVVICTICLCVGWTMILQRRNKGQYTRVQLDDHDNDDEEEQGVRCPRIQGRNGMMRNRHQP